MLAPYMLLLRVRLSVRTYGVRPSVTKTAKCRPTVVKCGQQAHLHMLSRIDDDGHLLITLSIHFCVQHDGRLGVMQRHTVHQR